MSDIDETDYLHEELQRQLRDLEYAKFREASVRRAREKRRMMVAITIAITTLGVTVYTLVGGANELLKITLVIALGGVFAGLALFYLRPSQVIREPFLDEIKSFNTRAYIDYEIEQALNRSKHANREALDFSDQDKAAILAGIQAKLESDALQGYVAGIKDIALARVREETFDERFQQTRRRLGQEVQDLAKRGNLNLILGILTTVFGLGILGYAVFTPPLTESVTELLSYFIPRVSLVLLIEVFAYFFLRLYKQSLSEIKYFQNELTNIEARNLALQVALRDDDLDVRTQVVGELAKTERNFILEKGQTTVEIERERISARVANNFSEQLSRAFKEKSAG